MKDSCSYDTFLAALGGYKLLTNLSYIAGSIYDYETGYLHEKDQVLLKIPPVPIKIDETKIEKNYKLLEKINTNELIYKHQLDFSGIKFIDSYPYLFEKVSEGEDELISLNFFGEFFLQKFKYSKIFINKRVREKIEKNKSKKRFIYTQLEKMVNKILKFERTNGEAFKGELIHDWCDWENTEAHLYKTKTGDIFRAAWTYNNGKIIIYCIWLNHSQYENDCSRNRLNYDEDWKELKLNNH